MTTAIRRTLHPGALLLIVLALTGCHGDPREELVGKVFEALRKKSAGAFMKTTITSADFDLRAQGISYFKESSSYLGTSLKPEQKKRQRRQFWMARAGGPGFIDFSEDRFLGLGTCLREETRETLLGVQIPVSVYSVRIRRDGKEVDTLDLFPKFAMVRLGESTYRLLELVLPDKSG